MRSSMAEQCTNMINMPMAQKDIFCRYGIIEAWSRSHIKSYTGWPFFGSLFHVIRNWRRWWRGHLRWWRFQFQNETCADTSLWPCRVYDPVSRWCHQRERWWAHNIMIQRGEISVGFTARELERATCLKKDARRAAPRRARSEKWKKRERRRSIIHIVSK